MDPGKLIAKLEAYPRVALAEYPTPLEHMPRVSLELGRPVYVKRDDGIGPAMGGNKTRKLEYLLAEAQQQGARRLVTFGGLQSNHCRISAAAARLCGMQPHLFYFEARPRRLTGNLLLNHLLGARMHFFPLGGGSSSMSLETTINLVRLLARLRVGRHYFIPVGGHSWLGCLGYVRAAVEIDAQARELGLDEAYLVMAAGTGGTLAGLMAGLALIDSPLRPLGIDVGKLWKAFPQSVANLANEICARLGERRNFTPEKAPMIERTYVGEGYARLTAAGTAAQSLVAHQEGLLLDPVYTAKAFAGMTDLSQTNKLGGETPLIFLHTGGAPGLFAT